MILKIVTFHSSTQSFIRHLLKKSKGQALRAQCTIMSKIQPLLLEGKQKCKLMLAIGVGSTTVYTSDTTVDPWKG